MTETKTTQENVVENVAKQARTRTATLKANGSRLRIVAQRKGGTAITLVATTDADKKTVRGMTEAHESFEAATAHLAVLTAKAEKAGWKRGAAAGGYAAKPDVFSVMPTAPQLHPAKKGK